MNIVGNTVTVTGTASDLDNDLSSVHLAVIGRFIFDEDDYNDQFNVSALIDCDGTTSWSCTYSADLATQYYINVYAKDQAGQVGPSTKIVKRNLGTSCNSETSSLDDHVSAGRAYKEQTGGYWMWYTYTWYATGTNEELGTSGSTVVTLIQRGENEWGTGSCPSPSSPIFSNVNTTTDRFGVNIDVQVSDTDNDILNVSVTYEDKTSTCLNNHMSTTYWKCNLGDPSTGNGQAVVTVIDLLGNKATSSISFTIEGESAPEISNIFSSIQDDSLVVTGTVTDANGNVDGVIMGSTISAGTPCSISGSSFTCSYDITGYNLGETVTVELVAVDATDLWSDVIIIEEVIPVPQAPIITQYNLPTVDGKTVIITGTASDADGDISVIYITDGMSTTICEGTENFSCTFDDLARGTNHALEIYGMDLAANEGERTDPIEVYIGYPPVINSAVANVNGQDVTINITGSDADNDIVGAILQATGGRMPCGGVSGLACVLTELPPGDYQYEVQLVDAQMNYSEFITVKFTIDPIVSSCVTAVNSTHANAGRATIKYNILAYAVGSNNYLGLSSATTSLEETSPSHWVKKTSCP